MKRLRGNPLSKQCMGAAEKGGGGQLQKQKAKRMRRYRCGEQQQRARRSSCPSKDISKLGTHSGRGRGRGRGVQVTGLRGGRCDRSPAIKPRNLQVSSLIMLQRNTCRRRSRWQQMLQNLREGRRCGRRQEGCHGWAWRVTDAKRKQNAMRKPLTKPQNATDIFLHSEQSEREG